jgi:hypothetical protein
LSRTLFGDMSRTSESPSPYQPEPWQPGDVQSAADPSPAGAAAFLATGGVLVGTLLVGLLGGLLWNLVAPKATYVVLSRGSADVVDAETRAFIEGDAVFVLVAIVGGLVVGFLAYRLAIRKYGPMPMLAVLGASVVAGLLARWVGENLGLARFNNLLLTSHKGALLHAPPVLGAQGSMILWPAIVFWPLAASLIPAGVLLLATLRDRQSPSQDPPGPRPFGDPPS